VAYLIAEVIFEQFLICIVCVNIANKEAQWMFSQISHYGLAATYRDVFHAATGNALAPCNVTDHLIPKMVGLKRKFQKVYLG